MNRNTEKLRKLLAIAAASLLLILTLAGCGGKRAETDEGASVPTINEEGEISLPTVADGENEPSAESNGQSSSDETQKPTGNSGNNGNGGNSGNNGNGGNSGNNGGGNVPTPGSLG